MSEQEFGTCNVCRKEAVLMRKSYYYDADCDCCVGVQHFHTVKYCENCTPNPPTTIKIVLETSRFKKQS